MRVLLVLLLLVLGSEAARAGYLNGNGLYAMCSNEESDTEFGLCTGYVQALADYITAQNVTRKACTIAKLPSESGNLQLVDVVTKYLRDNPAQRHQPAVRLVPTAFQQAFPCPK